MFSSIVLIIFLIDNVQQSFSFTTSIDTTGTNFTTYVDNDDTELICTIQQDLSNYLSGTAIGLGRHSSDSLYYLGIYDFDSSSFTPYTDYSTESHLSYDSDNGLFTTDPLRKRIALYLDDTLNIVDSRDGTLLYSNTPSITNYKMIEYDIITGDLIGFYWDTSSEIETIVAINPTTAAIDRIIALTDSTSVIQHTRTIDYISRILYYIGKISSLSYLYCINIDETTSTGTDDWTKLQLTDTIYSIKQADFIIYGMKHDISSTNQFGLATLSTSTGGASIINTGSGEYFDALSSIPIGIDEGNQVYILRDDDTGTSATSIALLDITDGTLITTITFTSSDISLNYIGGISLDPLISCCAPVDTFNNLAIEYLDYGWDMCPTQIPTNSPTKSPSIKPTFFPTVPPTNYPSQPPTRFPSQSPSQPPTNAPSYSPSAYPSGSPSQPPSNAPSFSPSMYPSQSPSQPPTNAPSGAPSQPPTAFPSSAPSIAPTNNPTDTPTAVPSSVPSIAPSM